MGKTKLSIQICYALKYYIVILRHMYGMIVIYICVFLYEKLGGGAYGSRLVLDKN